MRLFERFAGQGYEQVVFCHDESVGLKAIISIHDSTLGPGTGGCRMYPYASEDDAIEDVLRLSRGMTYKAAITGLKMGGAKAVIIGDPKKDKTPELLKRFGQFVESLNGRYITAKDVGIGGEDLKIIHQHTKHVLGIEGMPGSSGDPSVYTGWGVYNGIKAAAKHVYGSESLKGKRIAVQGLGKVSHYLISHLVKDGAQVVGADIDKAAAESAKAEFGIELGNPETILFEQCDILSPNALGGVINAKTIGALKCRIVAGGANNQLATEEDGYALMKRGIVYAPDYAINAGGLTNIYHEWGGYNAQRAWDHVAQIKETILNILDRSKLEATPPHIIADRIAEERVKNAKSR